MTVPPQQPPGPPAGWQQPSGVPGPSGPPPQPGPPQPDAAQPGWPQQPVPPQPGWAPQPPNPQWASPGGWPGQPGPPPGGWAPPPPQLPVTNRIPEDQPFVARPSVRKRALFLGGLLLFVLLMLACPLGLAASNDGGLIVLLGGLAFFALLVGLPLGFQLWLVTSGGPVLAVGPAGLWIKTRPTRGQAIWLPWEAIDQIYRRRWALEKMVCVKPRDPRTGSNLGAFTALDSGMQQVVFGTGLTATVNFADRSEQEIMQAITHFSAGRCRIS
ncbi:hypothetical protein AB0J86_19980 [Micromonospora sp. NPDC049559]|uniref:hypothetical protein n=1 Tax=Micromonospora sp. NPDC049559 TaxID=3155923 RepID=UPI00342F9BC0